MERSSNGMKNYLCKRNRCSLFPSSLQHFCYSDIDADDDLDISLKGRTFLGTRIVVTIRAEDLLKQSQATPEGMLIYDLPVCQGEHNQKYY